MTVTSTYDHRIIQGAESGAFLARVHELLSASTISTTTSSATSASRTSRCAGRRTATRRSLGGDRRRDEIVKQARVLELINAYRVRGHLLADIDPLHACRIAASPGARHRDLRADDLGPRPRVHHRRPGGKRERPLREILDILRRAYCGKVGTEYLHIQSTEQKLWIASSIRRSSSTPSRSRRETKRRCSIKLIARRTVRALPAHEVPRPEALLARRLRDDHPAARPPRRARGRAGRRRHHARHGAPRPPERARQRRRQLLRADLHGLRGHRPPGLSGGRGRREVPPGRDGRARDGLGQEGEYHRLAQPEPPRIGRPGRRGHGARQAGACISDAAREEVIDRALPVLLHGDAAFAGQGIVMETLNLADCAATAPAAPSTSSSTTRSASRPARRPRARRITRPTWRR